MNDKQHTIKAPVTVRGIGLHTGVEATMTFCPAPVGHGYKFQRTDLPGEPIVDADVDNVVDLSRGTTIEQNGARVNTVEHTLAALVGLQLDNVLIKLSGPEPPIMDGSSYEFIQALNSVGFEEQNALRNYYVIPDTIRYVDNARGVEIAALPLAEYRLTVMVDYNSPVLGSQHATLTDINQFESEIASSRTFCFLHELEYLYKSNLIKGGDLSNAIVVVDRAVGEDELDELAAMLGKPKVSVKKEGILNNVDLRHKNEPARHKLLDIVGDLALVGRPLKGSDSGRPARPRGQRGVCQENQEEDAGRQNQPDSGVRPRPRAGDGHQPHHAGAAPPLPVPAARQGDSPGQPDGDGGEKYYDERAVLSGPLSRQPGDARRAPD